MSGPPYSRSAPLHHQISRSLTSGFGWRAVASDDLPAGTPHLAGPVRVDGELPAHLMQQDVMMPPAPVFEVSEAGGAAVGAVPHMVRFTAGRGLVAAAHELAALSHGRGMRLKWPAQCAEAPVHPPMPPRIRSPQGPRDIDRLARKGHDQITPLAPCTLIPDLPARERTRRVPSRSRPISTTGLLMMTATMGCSTGFTGSVTETRARQRAPGCRTAQAGLPPVRFWDSDTDYERFRDEKLGPALRGFGRLLPTIEMWPIQTVRMLRTS